MNSKHGASGRCFGSEKMSVNINKVAKQLIENQPPINSFEKLTDEGVLHYLIEDNKFWLLQFGEKFLQDIYYYLFRLLTVDCLIKIKKSTHTIKVVKKYTKHNGQYTPQIVEKLEYCYEFVWGDDGQEKEIQPEISVKTVTVEFETPPKHNLLIKINNSFPLKGYLPELGEDFDYNQQFSAIKELVKDAYSMFVSEIQKTNKMPRIEFLVNRLIKEMNLELTHWSDVSKFENIVELRIDGVDFSAKIEKIVF